MRAGIAGEGLVEVVRLVGIVLFAGLLALDPCLAKVEIAKPREKLVAVDGNDGRKADEDFAPFVFRGEPAG